MAPGCILRCAGFAHEKKWKREGAITDWLPTLSEELAEPGNTPNITIMKNTEAATRFSSFRGSAGLARPIYVYNNWSAYDELSDNVRLTEDLAMRELDEIVRLRESGVRIDAYLMDAFWFACDGGYRTWRKADWPAGPDRWFARCQEYRILPGMWFAVNSLQLLDLYPAWRDSFDGDKALSMFEGGFLADFISALQHWYDAGVRLFKMDFAVMDAATPSARERMPRTDIAEANTRALIAGLRTFRERNPESVFLAYNGFGGEYAGTAAPIEQTVITRWLEVFDTMYCGDPRPSDAPMASFWRSCDVYTDHMVRYYERNQVPLERIDNAGFMLGKTGTNYGRGAAAWKSALILEMARGGWMNVVHGNLELLTDADAAWYARVQRMYEPLLPLGRTHTFGSLPGLREPYGFCSADRGGALYAVVNPAAAIRQIEMPRLTQWQPDPGGAVLLFADAGFAPELRCGAVTLGPGQMALVGAGRFVAPEYNLGRGADLVIPKAIEPVFAVWRETGRNAVEAEFIPPAECRMLVQMQQFVDGVPLRVNGGWLPEGRPMSEVLRITVEQDGRSVPLRCAHDRTVWSGMSWGSAEVAVGELHPEMPVRVRCEADHDTNVGIRTEVYAVR